MNFASKLGQVSSLSELNDMAERVKAMLGRIDVRMAEGHRFGR